MKRLILMRHAKSDWSDITASDHERALNTRGRHDAHVMGDWMSAKALQPDHVLCSDATRTRETLADLTLDDVRITFTRSLYLAEPDVMARALHTRDEPCVLIIAHNPGCGMLANMLLTNIPKHAQFNSYPTGATLVADFNIPRWQDLRHHTESVIHFCVPRDLTV